MNNRWRTVSALLNEEAVEVETVTVRCPLCGHVENMSKEMAEKYDLSDTELCEDCYKSIPKIDGIPFASCKC